MIRAAEPCPNKSLSAQAVSAVCLHYTEAMPQQLVRLGSLGYRGICYCGRMCRASLVITGNRMSTRVLTLRPNCSSAYSSPSSKPSNSLLEFRQDKQNLRQRCSKHNSAKTYPTRHDIQHGMVPHTARCPHGTVSHTARYPTRHGIPHGMLHVACELQQPVGDCTSRLAESRAGAVWCRTSGSPCRSRRTAASPSRRTVRRESQGSTAD